MLPLMTGGAPRHDLLALTGGAIGQGLPCAVGAAIACPDRPVLALVGDGSAMYTIQALWTMAREKLNVIAIVMNNRSYAILNVELQRVGAASVGPVARSQLDLGDPALDFVQMGLGLGVSSVRATTTADFVTALEHALAHTGPAPDRGGGSEHDFRPEAQAAAARARFARRPAGTPGSRDQAQAGAIGDRGSEAMSIALVTGANRGIGLELVRQLVARGTKVVAVCRHSSPELDSLGVRVESGCDVTDPEAGSRLAAKLGSATLDLLVHNAGMLVPDSLGGVEPNAVRAQFELNAMAPLFLTKALLPCLRAGAKVALVTSRMGSIGDNGSGSYYGYRMSKAALNAAGVSLARDLAPHRIAVAILHPGAVRTDMTGGTGTIEVEESVRGLLARIDELTLETSGSFLHQNGEVLPW